MLYFSGTGSTPNFHFNHNGMVLLKRYLYSTYHVSFHTISADTYIEIYTGILILRLQFLRNFVKYSTYCMHDDGLQFYFSFHHFYPSEN